MTAAHTGSSFSADCVYFIYKHNTRSVFLCLFKQISHSRCTYTDIKFNEIRTAYREKRNFRLSGNRLCKKCFTCTRRADKKYTLRYSRTKTYKLLRIFQKLDYFRKFGFFLISSSNIFKCHVLGVLIKSCSALCKIGCTRTAFSQKSEKEHTYKYNYQNYICNRRP